MNPDHQPTRREWIGRAMELGAVPLLTPAALLALQEAHHAAQSGETTLRYFEPAVASEVAALAAQIIPSDETAGAQEAGVIVFIDHALASFEEQKRQAYKDGMAEAQGARARLFPESRSLAELKPGQIIAVLRVIEKTEFFELLRQHTIIGFLASPSWGGNREGSGWKAIGFEDGHAFQPPFGWYDTPGNLPEEK